MKIAAKRRNVRVTSTIVCLALLLNGHRLVAQHETESIQELSERGQRALSNANYVDAQEAFEQLAKREPGIAEIHANLGLIYFERRNFEQAVPALRRALQLKPSLTRSAGILAMSLSELGKYSEALLGLEKGFRSTDLDMKRMCGLQLERTYSGLKRDGDAVRIALAMERLYPNDPEVQYHDGKIFGNFAFLTMQKLWQASPDSIWKHQAEGEALESQGSYEAAIGHYQDVLTRDPNRPGIHYRLGRVFLARSQKTGSTDDVNLAKQEFEKELARDAGNGNAAYEIAEIERNAGRYESAQKSFEDALRGHPDFEEAHLGLAATLIALHQPQPALAHLQRAIALNRDNEVAWWRLAQVERLLGNADEQKHALAEFQRLHSQAASQQDSARGLFSPNEVTQQQVDTAPTN
jgi:tetratricopeptide (TPR) repeat protein